VEIGNLAALQTLKLGGTQLTFLPPGIGNLTALLSLDLSRNIALTFLPAELGNLAALKTLVLLGYVGELPLPAELLKLKETGLRIRM